MIRLGSIVIIGIDYGSNQISHEQKKLLNIRISDRKELLANEEATCFVAIFSNNATTDWCECSHRFPWRS